SPRHEAAGPAGPPSQCSWDQPPVKEGRGNRDRAGGRGNGPLADATLILSRAPRNDAGWPATESVAGQPGVGVLVSRLRRRFLHLRGVTGGYGRILSLRQRHFRLHSGDFDLQFAVEFDPLIGLIQTTFLDVEKDRALAVLAVQFRFLDAERQ